MQNPLRGENVLVGVRAGGRGDITDTHVVWEKTRELPYVASPLIHDGRVYYIKKGGLVSCIDAESGEARYQMKRLGLGGEYYATPIGVGDRIIAARSAEPSLSSQAVTSSRLWRGTSSVKGYTPPPPSSTYAVCPDGRAPLGIRRIEDIRLIGGIRDS